VTWSAWEPYATSKTWTLTGGNGTKTVYAQYRDSQGNESAKYSDTIILDGTAPTGSIVIESGAASTELSVVQLSMTFADTGGSGLKQMRFSNDGANWGVWESLDASVLWTLSTGSGTKTVYVQFSDWANNVSTYSDAITFNPNGKATLWFRWEGEGDADLRVENSLGETIASTSVTGSYDDLSWRVAVPAGEDYYMVCDYFWDDWEEFSGGNYGVWTNNTSINPDGILSIGEVVIWNY